jgi:hypothetical protein
MIIRPTILFKASVFNSGKACRTVQSSTTASQSNNSNQRTNSIQKPGCILNSSVNNSRLPGMKAREVRRILKNWDTGKLGNKKALI